MAQNGYGPVSGHVGRIPNFGKTQVNPMGNEPPACIQNAMMTKDKKPFTYTPGGLDLSQIRTPSMARRMARQRSLEEQQEQAQAQYGGGNYHPQGGPVPPPPPPPKIPAPPPPPPIVIDVPQSKSPKPPAPGERPEIVIPENPIGMLRKTNSPYHWEAEKAEMQRMGHVPKFQEKVPSPLTVKMPPSSFTQQPQNYTPPGQNRQNYSYGSHTPESPIHKPEAQYAHQKSNSPNVNGSPPMREFLQRQDSQFNKSPQPFGTQSPLSNGSTYSPSPNNNWRQPEKRDSPLTNVNNSPLSPQFQRAQYSPASQQPSPNYQNQSPSSNSGPQFQRGQYSPASQQPSPNYQNQSPSSNSGPQFHTLPRTGQRNQESFANNNQNNNVIYNNTREASPKVESSAPWRSNTLNRQLREAENVPNIYHNSQSVNQQPTYNPPWKSNDSNNNDNNYIPPWKQENRSTGNQAQNQQYTPPWVAAKEANNNREQENVAPWRSQNNERTAPVSPPSKTAQQEPPRYQSTMSIPVTPKRQPQPEYNTPPQKEKEVVYVNQEPVYFCPESPKAIPPWVKTQKEKTKTPPPVWVQRPLDGRRSIPRELSTPPRDSNQEPEWVKKSNEMQRNAREVISPPKYQQGVPPTWSTLPSENRRSVTRESAPSSQSQGSRIIPIQMEVTSTETRDGRQGHHQPQQLRIVIDMQNPNSQSQSNAQVPFSPPTQRIMRVLSPQLVRLDDGPAQNELPTLNRNFQPNQESQPKTRIIPIQIEGGGNGGANRRVFYHKFTQEGPPRQSKAFKVLQVITGTQELDNIQTMEQHHGFSDL